jgi:hypothetical protein
MARSFPGAGHFASGLHGQSRTEQMYGALVTRPRYGTFPQEHAFPKI